MSFDARVSESQGATLRRPEELVKIGFERSRVVMMNEAHDGLMRCVRTREVGRLVLPAAHSVGARHVAMEAMWSRDFVKEANRTRRVPGGQRGYLSQPEMRALIQDALDLGWMLIAYEADMDSPERPSEDLMSPSVTRWREEVQAKNLAAALNTLPSGSPLFVWCGNSHLSKVPACDWAPMALHFRNVSGVEAFAIDQTVTVAWSKDASQEPLIQQFTDQLRRLGGSGGFLVEEGGVPEWTERDDVDAVVLSLENDLI